MSTTTTTTEEVSFGTSETSWGNFDDASGDAQRASLRKINVIQLVVILFAVGAVISLIAFFSVYRCEIYRKQKEALAKAEKEENEINSKALSQRSSDGSSTVTGESDNTSVKGEDQSPEEREKAIEEGLVVQPWAPEVMNATTFVTAASGNDNGQAAAAAAFVSCAICKKDYKKSDLVCSSYSRHCGHVFHKTCMVNWLAFQNRCPMCNESYLLSQQDQQA